MGDIFSKNKEKKGPTLFGRCDLILRWLVSMSTRTVHQTIRPKTNWIHLFGVRRPKGILFVLSFLRQRFESFQKKRNDNFDRRVLRIRRFVSKSARIPTHSSASPAKFVVKTSLCKTLIQSENHLLFHVETSFFDTEKSSQVNGSV